MRRLGLAAATLILLAPALLPLAASAGPFTVTASATTHVAAGQGVSIAGTVRLGGLAIPSAIVHIEEDGVRIGQTMTAPDGRYAFPVVHATRGAHAYVAVVTREGGALVESRSAPVVVAWAVAPSAAPAPTVVQGTHGQEARLTWTAPADDGGAPMVRAHVYRDTGSGTWMLIGTTSTRAFTVDGLAWGSTAAFQVREENVAGIGPVGASTTYVVPAPVAPAAPTGLAATFHDHPARVHLYFDPASGGNGMITGYEVETTRDGLPFSPEDVHPSPQRFHFYTGYGHDYEMRVRALSTAGPSPWSAWVGIDVPDVDGLRLDIADITVIQKWPLNERWIYAAEGGTTHVYGNLTILLGTRGDLHHDNVPQPHTPMTLHQSLTWAGPSLVSGSISFNTDAWAQYYNAVFLEVPSLAPGQCVTYTGTSTGTAGAHTASDTATFTLCGRSSPPS